MKQKSSLTKITILSLFAFSQFNLSAQLKPNQSGFASVNDSMKVYYEVYGEGQPIVLLHGLYMTINTNWSDFIPKLAKTRKVIAIEMQSHGHTPYSARKLSFAVLADDVVKVLQHLKIDSADIFGYSVGGSIAYELAIAHPKMVKKLFILSSTYKTEGWQIEIRNTVKELKPEFFYNTPFKKEYFRVAPDTSKWKSYLQQMIDFDNEEFNLGDEDVKKIKSAVLIIAGDNDGIDKPVLISTYKLLGGAVSGDVAGIPKNHLAVLPGNSHGSLIMNPDKLFELINNF